MDKEQWDIEWYDRMMRYAQRYLDPSRTIAITAEPEFAASLDGQVALLTAATLLSRMTPSVVAAFPDLPIVPALPWAGQSLRGTALTAMQAANPYASYGVRELHDDDFRFHLGPSGAEHVVHGAGWNAYAGPSPSPLDAASASNGLGAAFAVIVAVAQLFRNPFRPFETPFIGNAFDWSETQVSGASALPEGAALGHIMTMGLGSVGSAAHYFLTLVTRNYRATLIDRDRVKVKNITRSPIFSSEDARLGVHKVTSVARFLNAAGVMDVTPDDAWLHQSPLWESRALGTPDIVIAAANEYNVRYHIEMGYPPIQVYATTGMNWQATLFQHVPGAPACSLCMFPPDEAAVPMACASDGSSLPALPEQVDAALPFLSFSAGLMTASAIIRLAIGGYTPPQEKVSLLLGSEAGFMRSPLFHRAGCVCETRSPSVHRKMIATSRYCHE